LSRSVRVAHGLVRAASAFLEVLARRPPVEVRRPRVPETAAGEAPASGVQEAPRATVSSGPPRPAMTPAAPRPGVENRCPVCQARFRGARFCPRCGADLEPLMRLAVKAWQLRQAARQALDAGDVERASGLAAEAQGTQATGSGAALRLLGAWLQTGGESRSGPRPR
jgi:hypothetical protein